MLTQTIQLFWWLGCCALWWWCGYQHGKAVERRRCTALVVEMRHEVEAILNPPPLPDPNRPKYLDRQ